MVSVTGGSPEWRRLVAAGVSGRPWVTRHGHQACAQGDAGDGRLLIANVSPDVIG
jgi:hypothetical protein